MFLYSTRGSADHRVINWEIDYSTTGQSDTGTASVSLQNNCYFFTILSDSKVGSDESNINCSTVAYIPSMRVMWWQYFTQYFSRKNSDDVTCRQISRFAIRCCDHLHRAGPLHPGESHMMLPFRKLIGFTSNFTYFNDPYSTALVIIKVGLISVFCVEHRVLSAQKQGEPEVILEMTLTVCTPTVFSSTIQNNWHFK